MQGEDLDNLNKELEALNCNDEENAQTDFFEQAEEKVMGEESEEAPKDKQKSGGSAPMIKKDLAIETRAFSNPLTVEQESYKNKIKEFIEMEKVKLIFKACKAGMPED